MTLGFFPQLYPDELLYSAVARYAHYTSSAGSRTNEILLGGNERRFTHDIPNNIKQLIDRTGIIDIETAVREHTLLPFYTALADKEKYAEARDRMIAGENITFLVKPARVAAPWPDRLRYCPQCEDDCRKNYGTAIWLRRHQLVTSIVCPEHGGILLESNVDVSAQRSRDYEPASKPKINPVAVAFPHNERVMKQYRELTLLGHSMLNSQNEPEKWWPRIDFVDLAHRKGFRLHQTNSVDMVGLIAEFNRQFAEVLELWPQLDNWEGRRGQHWMHLTVSRTRKFISPVNHALARIFLEGHPDGAGNTGSRETVRKPQQPKLKPALHKTLATAQQDGEFAEKVRRRAVVMKAITPPERVSRTNIVRSIDGLHAALIYHKMPLTRAALVDEHEDRKKFLRRRLQWFFDEAAKKGEAVSIKQLNGTYSFQDLWIVKEEWARYYSKANGEYVPVSPNLYPDGS